LLGQEIRLGKEGLRIRQRIRRRGGIALRKSLSIVAVIFFAASIALPAIPSVRRGCLSAAKRFSIDGKSFTLDSPASDDLSLIRRELERQGIVAPHLGISRPPNRYFAEGLRESFGAAPGNIQPLPPGLRAEHVLRTDSDRSRVELALGSMEGHGPQIRRRLSDSGWNFAAPIASMQ
jgi:hypothetical protein